MKIVVLLANIKIGDLIYNIAIIFTYILKKKLALDLVLIFFLLYIFYDICFDNNSVVVVSSII